MLPWGLKMIICIIPNNINHKCSKAKKKVEQLGKTVWTDKVHQRNKLRQCIQPPKMNLRILVWWSSIHHTKRLLRKYISGQCALHLQKWTKTFFLWVGNQANFAKTPPSPVLAEAASAQWSTRMYLQIMINYWSIEYVWCFG